MIKLKPITVKQAAAFVREHHRHLPRVVGGLFAIAVENEAKEIVGVGIAGHPPRVWLGSGRLVVTRVATDGTPNACSMIYGSLVRAAKALGYAEVWTYTLESEPGSSLRAAGFQEAGKTRDEDCRQFSRPGRKVQTGGSKTRWLRRC